MQDHGSGLPPFLISRFNPYIRHHHVPYASLSNMANLVVTMNAAYENVPIGCVSAHNPGCAEELSRIISTPEHKYISENNSLDVETANLPVPTNYQRIWPRSIEATINVPIHDLRVGIDTATVIQGGAIHRAFVAPHAEVPLVGVVISGHLDAGQAPLVVDIFRVAIGVHEVGADCRDIIDGGVEVDPFPGNFVVHAHFLAVVCQWWLPYLGRLRRLTCIRPILRRTIKEMGEELRRPGRCCSRGTPR